MHGPLSGAQRRSLRATGRAAGRNLFGCDRGPWGPFGGDRQAADYGTADRERSRRRFAGPGASQYRRMGGTHSISSGNVFNLAGSSGSSRRPAGARPVGRSGSEPLSAYLCAPRVFDLGRWSAGHAHGSISGHDCGRFGQLCRREGTCRFDLSIRRRKEGAEDSQSNRSGAANTEHTTSGWCSGAGRAPNGPSAPRHPDLHGAAYCGQRGAAGVGRAARTGPGFSGERRADCHHFVHVA